MAQEKIEKTFNISGAARLELSNIRGLVEVRPGEAGVIQVTAIKYTETGDASNTEIELSQSGDGTVIAAARFPDGWWSWLLGSTPCKVDFLVKMPREASLKLRGVSNNAFVEGLSGDFDIKTVSGDLTLTNLSGSLSLEAVSGDLLAEKLNGDLRLTVVSGDIRVLDSHLVSVKANTTSGNLDFETDLAAGPYRFNSVSGNVALSLPEGTSCSAQLQSISGRIRGEDSQTARSFGHGSQRIDFSGGGTPVALHSVSGDLRLRVSGKLQPAAPRANRREILEQLERGEINPEQALAGLKG